MTVAQLIAALSLHDPTAGVYREDGEFGPQEVTGVAWGYLPQPDDQVAERRTIADAQGTSALVRTTRSRPRALVVVIGDGDGGDLVTGDRDDTT